MKRASSATWWSSVGAAAIVTRAVIRRNWARLSVYLGGTKFLQLAQDTLPVTDGQDPLKSRVLIIYQHLPHYRYGVFRELETDELVEVEYAAARHSRDRSIPTIPSGMLRTVHIVQNRWLGRFLWQSGVLRLILSRRPDATIFLGDYSYLTTWLGAILCRIMGIAVLFWTIGWHHPDSGIRRLCRLAFYRLANQLLLYSETGRAIGIELGYPAARMTIIYNSSSSPPRAAESDSISLDLLSSRLPSGIRPVATAVVRFNYVKRLDMLISAAGLLREQGLEIDVLLVGTGPELERLIAQAADRGVRLHIAGPVYSQDGLRMVYDVTDVTVVPSVAGLTVLQSLRFGRPVITHDNPMDQAPECEAILSGVTGDYYRQGDVPDLARVLRVWTERQRDSRIETSESCIRSVEKNWSARTQARLISAELALSINARRRG